MNIFIIEGFIVAALSSFITAFVVKKINRAKFDIFIEQAKAKAKVIEHEAEVILKDAQLKAKREFEKEFRHAKRDYDEMFSKIQRKEKELNEHLESELKLIRREKEEIEENNRIITSLKEGLKNQKKTYEEKIAKALKVLENASGLTQQEAKSLMLEKIQEDSRAQIASIFRKNINSQNKMPKMKSIICSHRP